MFNNYISAINDYPEDPEFPFRRGVYWWLEGDYEKAITDFNQALASPKLKQHQKTIHLWALYYIGRISLKTEKHIQRGLNAFQQFIDSYESVEGETLPSIEWVRNALVDLSDS